MAVSADASVVATDGHVFSELGGDVVILNLKDGLYYGLNAIGSRVWTLIQEPAAVRQICATLLDEYEVAPGPCEQDLLLLLDDMLASGLIEVCDGSASTDRS